MIIGTMTDQHRGVLHIGLVEFIRLPAHPLHALPELNILQAGRLGKCLHLTGERHLWLLSDGVVVGDRDALGISDEGLPVFGG